MLVGQRYLNGVQVLTLDILHQCHLHDVLVLDGTYVGGDSLQTSQL